MKTFAKLLSIVALSLDAQAVVVAPGSGAQFPRVTQLVPVQWTGPVFPGGVNHTFMGTVQDIVGQIKQKNPDYQLANANATAADGDGDDEVGANLTSPLAKRNPQMVCNVPGDRCAGLTAAAAAAGVNYIAGLDGDCGLPAGPGTCGRISCSDNTAITWCNDNDQYRSWKCRDFAVYAADVIRDCTVGPYTWGQEFDVEHFNVIVNCAEC